MSIIGTWLELPVRPLLLLLAAFYLATGTIIHLLSFYGPTGRWCANFKGVVGPFFTSVTVIFGFLAGFVAGDVWRRSAEAGRVVRAEANALLALYWLIDFRLSTPPPPYADAATSSPSASKRREPGARADRRHRRGRKRPDLRRRLIG